MSKWGSVVLFVALSICFLVGVRGQEAAVDNTDTVSRSAITYQCQPGRCCRRMRFVQYVDQTKEKEPVNIALGLLQEENKEENKEEVEEEIKEPEKLKVEENTDSKEADNKDVVHSTFESEVIKRVNELRSKSNLPTLKPREDMCLFARSHSRYMHSLGWLHHDQGYIECIAQTVSGQAQEAVNLWTHSAPHYRILTMPNATTIAVGHFGRFYTLRVW